MKVLFIVGGMPHYYNLVLNKLNKFSDIEIVVAAPSDLGKTVGTGVHQTREGIEFTTHYLAEYKTYYGKMFFKNIGQLINKEKPNIIISNWPYQLAWIFFPFLYLNVRLKKIKLISKEIPFQVPYYKNAIEFYRNGGGISENGETLQKKKGFLFKLKYHFITEIRKLMVNRMDAHINYFDEALEIQKSYGVPENKVFITSNSPDTDLIFEAKNKIKEPILPFNNYRLIHVGRLVKWKRVDLIIDALDSLKNKFPTIELIVIGSGPEEVNLKKQVSKLNLTNYVNFIGGIYDVSLLGSYFMDSSIYVLAGMGGLSINEAMCFGLPVICSEADGTEKKLVKEGVNGLFFEKGNLESLKSKIDTMLSDLDKTKAMGIKSEQIIKNEININTVLEKYLEAFRFVFSK